MIYWILSLSLVINISFASLSLRAISILAQKKFETCRVETQYTRALLRSITHFDLKKDIFTESLRALAYIKLCGVFDVCVWNQCLLFCVCVRSKYLEFYVCVWSRSMVSDYELEVGIECLMYVFEVDIGCLMYVFEVEV